VRSRPLLTVENLSKAYFPSPNLLGQFLSRGSLIRAVNDVSFTLWAGETLGLVGESGSGKSTVARLILLLETKTKGNMVYKDMEISGLRGSDLHTYRRQVQMIFQDPYESLNPRYNTLRTLDEPLKYHEVQNHSQRLAMIEEILNLVGLRPASQFLFKYPHELSGGQRQRVAIARALILRPELVVADEPFSMLDASVRAGLMDSFVDLRKQMGLSVLLITHDISIARYLCDRIAVIYYGGLVEVGPAASVVGASAHPYTQLLISAVPTLQSGPRQRTRIHFNEECGGTELRHLKKPENSCCFVARCPSVQNRCRTGVPSLCQVGFEHSVACFLRE